MNILNNITIKGYKSIKCLDNLELDRLNVLIGANGAGKSNLLSFFRLLNNMTFADNLQFFIGLEGGGNIILHDGAETTLQIEAQLSFESSQGSNEYAFKLFHAASDTLIFADEKYRFSDNDFASKTDWRQCGSGHRESKLLDITNDSAQYILKLLKKCVVYQFHNTSDKSRLHFKQSMDDGWYLKSDAANLAPFLYRIREEYPLYYRRIVTTIRQVTPFFNDFELEPNSSNQLLLQWTEKNSDIIFTAYQGSDGTLRTMALIALLLQPKESLPNVIILDEPELGLHPRAIDILAGLIHRASFNTQIILATQSPTLVNYFKPENIIVVERRNRESIYTRLNPSELEGWLSEYTAGGSSLDAYSLGELWEKNVIGGNP